MTLPILTQVRWTPHRYTISVLLFALLTCNVEYSCGAPSAQFGQGSQSPSGAQGKQNPSEPFGHFRFQVDDDDSREHHSRSRSRSRSSVPHPHFGGTLSGSQSSFGVPLNPAKPGQRSDAPPSSFGIPLPNSQPSHRSGTQSSKTSQSFGIPLSTTQHDQGSGSSQGFGVPLSSTQSGQRTGDSPSFGAPLSATQNGQGSGGSPAFGVPLSAAQPGASNTEFSRQDFPSRSFPRFTVERESLEDVDDNDDDDFGRTRGRSPFSPTHSSRSNIQRNRGRFSSDDDDDVSFEDIDSSNEFISLGRRFHPMGIPKRSEPLVTSFNSPSSAPAVFSNPFIVTSDSAFGSDESIEDDDTVLLSPLIKAYNHRAHNERLSLAKDFMNQYNFVDVKGSTNWGYSTKDQYQEHKLHSDGAMEGKFGWTAPEGSQVNIEYIADKGGYRVVSSTGLYTRDAEDVLRQKEIHFAEHDKARKNHAKVVNERRPGHKNNIGVPLPTPTKDSGKHSQPGSEGFVVVRDDDDDDDDFTLVHGGPSVGVPQPGEVGVFIDTTSSGVSLPTLGQGQSSGFGIPLPSSGSDGAAGSSGTQEFGIPLPDSGIPSGNVNTNFGIPLPGSSTPTGGSESSSTSGASDFGISLPRPGAPSTGSDSAPGFGIPLPESSAPSGGSDPSFTSKSPGFGIPLPGSQTPSGGSDPSFISKDPGFGIPLSGSQTPSGGSDPSFISKDPGFGISLPGSQIPSGGGDPSLTSDVPGFGIPLSGSQTPSGSQGFGIPLQSDVPVSSGNIPPSSGVGISLHGSVPSDSREPSFSPDTSDFGIGLPGSGAAPSINESPSESGQGFGIPLSGATPGVRIPEPSPNQGFGISTGSESFSPNFPSRESGVPLPGAESPFDSRQPIDSTSNQGFGISLQDVNQDGQDTSFPSRQGFGIPLGTSQTGETQFGGQSFPSSSQDSFGVPLSSSGVGSSNFGQDLGPQSSVGVSLPSSSTNDKTSDSSFGLGLDFSNAGGNRFNINAQPSRNDFGGSFGVPLNSGVTAGKSSDTGVSANEFNSFDRDITGQDGRENPGIKLQFDTLNTQGRGSTFESEVDPTAFGIMSSENSQSQGGFSSQGVFESTSSTKFSNNDPNFDANNVGVPLSSHNSFSSNFDRSSTTTPSESFSSGSTGISLFSNFDSTAPQNTNVDLLQGPPVDQISQDGFDPCLNSKIHPSLLPPECFGGANDVQPNQKIGKSLSETNKNRAEDSFIVVVNSDLFQQ